MLSTIIINNIDTYKDRYKESSSLCASVIYHEYRGYQSYLPEPIMEILGNPKTIRFIIKNRKIEVEAGD
jgi:hypothetical protein